MDLRSAGILVCLPTLCTSLMAADSPWWDSAWQFRTAVMRPLPCRQREPRVVETVVDLPGLLAGAGMSGSLDPASLRVVDPRSSAPVPCVAVPENRDGAPGGLLRVSWIDQPGERAAEAYHLYFDTAERRRPPAAYPADKVPPENLLADGDFESLSSADTAVWSATPASLAQPGTFRHSTGRQSLRILVDETTPAETSREVTVSQTVQVAAYAGQDMVFEADLLAERASYGAPVCIELRQFRADGTRIPEFAVEPRWLALELAQGQLVQFRQRGRFSREAATVTVAIRLRLTVTDADSGKAVTGPESCFTVWVDRVTMRPAELWPWPAATHAGYAEGALEDAPLNRGFAFTGPRRLMFNGASEGTLTANDPGSPSSVHWGLQAGTLEFWCQPQWSADDGREHVFFEGIAYGHRLQSRLRRQADGRLEFCIWDSAGKAHEASGPAPFAAQAWHHIAAAWDFAAGLVQIHADGRRLARGSSEGAPWPHSLTESNDAVQGGRGIGEHDRRSMPMQAFIGGDKSWQPARAADAVIDEFRISDTVRYAADFTPPRREFPLDPQTRALFHFDHECHGSHAGDDQFVRGHLACELPLLLETAVLERLTAGGLEPLSVAVRPAPEAAVFEAHRAEALLPARRPFTAPPDPRFVACRERRVERIVSGTDDAFALHVAGDYEPWMLATTFASAAAEPVATLLPRWRANDNPVPFSVADLATTVVPPGASDAEKAFAAFRYALQTTNYYDAHYCETLPGGRHRPRVSYTLIKALNIYPMDQCGPMNHMLRKLFLAVGISSTDASGTHHQFQQAFYDGEMRLYDLSSRVYWLDRDNRTVIGRRRLEEDPYLKLRQGGDANAWLRGRRGQVGPGRAERPHSMDFALHPGERVSVCWHNEGRWFEMTGDRQPVSLAKIPPFFGNGAIRFEPGGQSGAMSLDQAVVEKSDGTTILRPSSRTAPGTMIYRAACPYILADGRIGGTYAAPRPDMIRLAVSVDEGQSWQPLWANADQAGPLDVSLRSQIAARYAYWLRAELAPDATLRGLQVRSTFVVSPWALPGRLALGANRITFVGGPVASPVRTSCAWIERHRSNLGVTLNALSFYLDSDHMNRQLCIVPPEAAFTLDVALSRRAGDASPLPPAAAVSVDRLPRGWSAVRVPGGMDGRAAFTVQLRGTRAGDVDNLDVCVGGPDGEDRRLPVTVLCAEAPVVAEAESAAHLAGDAAITDLPEASGARVVTFGGDGHLVFPATVVRAGRHALWVRARWDEGSSTAMRVTVDDTAPRAVRATAMIGFTDWTDPSRAHTKMFAHFGEQHGHWSWYRIPDIDLGEGSHRLGLAAGSGTQVDAVVLLPQNDQVDRAAMNLLMNWNYAPWRNPL